MRRVAGFVFLLSGLLVIFVGILLTGEMLAMTTPIFSLTDLLVMPLVAVGPSLLILTGVTEIGGGVHRVWSRLLSGGALVLVLAGWTVPRIGWRLSAWQILEPVAVGLLIAGILMLILKKSWVGATIGSALSAPLFLFGSGLRLYSYWISGYPFNRGDIWVFAPALLLISSFVLALYSRAAQKSRHSVIAHLR